jgi:hypothetical protein
MLLWVLEVRCVVVGFVGSIQLLGAERAIYPPFNESQRFYALPKQTFVVTSSGTHL